MDPSALLITEVAGMVIVAVVLTAILVRGTPRPSTVHALAPAREAPGLPVAIFCPLAAAPMKVHLGIVGERRQPAFAVLQCEYFADGPVTCERECLQAAVPA
ncbi:MAG: hypothetical protein HY704_15555 [Gemmatimonadetes bacterium]|nr:hypothetical protein [Gemmatimonadota bacterium]